MLFTLKEHSTIDCFYLCYFLYVSWCICTLYIYMCVCVCVCVCARAMCKWYDNNYVSMYATGINDVEYSRSGRFFEMLNLA